MAVKFNLTKPGVKSVSKGPTEADFAASYVSPADLQAPQVKFPTASTVIAEPGLGKSLLGVDVESSQTYPKNKASLITIDPVTGEHKFMGEITNIGLEFKEPLASLYASSTGSGKTSFALKAAISAAQTGEDLHKVVAEHILKVKEPTEDEALTDEYLMLEARLEAIDVDGINKRQGEIKKRLQAIASETIPADQEAVFSTDAGLIRFSTTPNTTEVVNPLAVIELLKSKGFTAEQINSAVSIGITPVKKLLSGNELESYTATKPGTRKLVEAKINPVTASEE